MLDCDLDIKSTAEDLDDDEPDDPGLTGLAGDVLNTRVPTDPILFFVVIPGGVFKGESTLALPFLEPDDPGLAGDVLDVRVLTKPILLLVVIADGVIEGESALALPFMELMLLFARVLTLFPREPPEPPDN